MFCTLLVGRAVDVKDNRGWRPIHEAAFNGHPGCLEFLLRQGKIIYFSNN